MDLYAVRWQENENEGFRRSEYVLLKEAIIAYENLKSEGKHNVHIKIVDSRTGKEKGNLEV